jgi:hypothetical protein
MLRHWREVDLLGSEAAPFYPTKVSGQLTQCRNATEEDGKRPTTRVQKGLERLLVAYGRRNQRFKCWVQLEKFSQRRN